MPVRHTCPFCDQGMLKQPYLALFHAWDALNQAERAMRFQPNVARAIERTKLLLQNEGMHQGLDEDEEA